MADAVSGVMPANDDYATKLDEVLASSKYSEMLDSCKSFNRVLLTQRKQCVPFIDQHTGLAQSDCGLWKQARERMPPIQQGQVFTYPAKRWFQRRRQYLYSQASQPPRLVAEEAALPITTVENPIFQEQPAVAVDEDLKESGWYYEMDKDEDVDANSDHSDFDFGDRYRRRKKTSTPKRSASSRSGSSRRKAAELDAEETPKRSKSSRSRQAAPPAPAPPPPPPEYDLPPRLSPPVPLPDTSNTSNQAPKTPEKKRTKPSVYCDFCLGDVTLNKKTGRSEELVSCADCGRSGHPTCLQFTANMIISVKKYRWQCIECKCCSLCGNSDNDEQLLFCDDCDRGYHMYCLKPPLVAPPEGCWSCTLCINEFHRPQQ